MDLELIEPGIRIKHDLNAGLLLVSDL
jgi:hypothetical protein